MDKKCCKCRWTEFPSRKWATFLQNQCLKAFSRCRRFGRLQATWSPTPPKKSHTTNVYYPRSLQVSNFTKEFSIKSQTYNLLHHSEPPFWNDSKRHFETIHSPQQAKPALAPSLNKLKLYQIPQAYTPRWSKTLKRASSQPFETTSPGSKLGLERRKTLKLTQLDLNNNHLHLPVYIRSYSLWLNNLQHGSLNPNWPGSAWQFIKVKISHKILIFNEWVVVKNYAIASKQDYYYSTANYSSIQ